MVLLRLWPQHGQDIKVFDWLWEAMRFTFHLFDSPHRARRGFFYAIKSEAHVHDCVLNAADFSAELGSRECIAEESLLGNFARGRRTERGEWLHEAARRHRMNFAHTFFEECDCPTRWGFVTIPILHRLPQ